VLTSSTPTHSLHDHRLRLDLGLRDRRQIVPQLEPWPNSNLNVCLGGRFDLAGSNRPGRGNPKRAGDDVFVGVTLDCVGDTDFGCCFSCIKMSTSYTDSTLPPT
jgi:hypothetical protein